MKLIIECLLSVACVTAIRGHPVTEPIIKDPFLQTVSKPFIKENPVIGENVFIAAKPGSILRIPENVFSSLQGEFSYDYPETGHGNDDNTDRGDDDNTDTPVKTSVNKGPSRDKISVEEVTEKVIENTGGVNTAENTDIKPSNASPTSKPQRAAIKSPGSTSKPQSPVINHSTLISPESLITKLPAIQQPTPKSRITPVTILLPSSSPNEDHTTNNPLDNLKDFTTWRANGANNFGTGFENEIEGNEFEFLDQLAVESENSAVTAHVVVAAPSDALPPYAISTVKSGTEPNNSQAPSGNSSVKPVNNRDYITEVIEPKVKTEKEPQVAPSIEYQAPSHQETITADATPSLDIKVTTLSRFNENMSTTELPYKENESALTPATTTPVNYPQLTHRTDSIFDSHRTDPPFVIHRRFTTEKLTINGKMSRKSPDPSTETTEPQIDKVRTDMQHKVEEVVEPPIRKTVLRVESNIQDRITPTTRQINREEDKPVPQATTRSSFLFIKKSPITVTATTTTTTSTIIITTKATTTTTTTTSSSTTTTTAMTTTTTISTTTTTWAPTTTVKTTTATEETEHVITHNQEIQQQKDDDHRAEILTPQDDHDKNYHDTDFRTLEGNQAGAEISTVSNDDTTIRNTEETTNFYADYPDNVLDEAAGELLPDPLPCLDANTLEEQFEDLPLVSISKNLPHAMMLLVKPSRVVPNTEVRIMYERVRHSRTPNVKYLSDPIVEYIAMVSNVVEHGLYDLPVGKYIVCGEAVSEGEVFQTNCFETVVQRPTDKNMLQTGVIALIIVAIIIAGAVVVYAAYYRAVLGKNKKKERELQEKVERFAKKERELQEKELAATSHNRTVFPDPNEPYEERCIM